MSRHAHVLIVAVALIAAACGNEAADKEAADETTTTAAPADNDGNGNGGETGTGEVDPVTTTTDPEEPEGHGDPLPTPTPIVSLPPETGGTFYSGIGIDLALVGYEQSEYFISGTARSFSNVGDLGSDGAWTVEPGDEADYTSRILVIRPTDPADFNGTVIMEWFNVSGGLDAAPNLTMSHVELLRSGYAYVGVSAQFRGIEQSAGTIDIGFPIFLKGIQPERYESLSHPGDSFSYDIFNQAAQSVLSPGDIDPLGGLDVAQIIATGESQSAFRLTTYVNAIDPVAQLFDGFLIHSRGGGSSALAQDPQGDITTPARVLIRDDVRVPVLTFQTDSDLLRLGWVPDRQPDAENFVLWEVAGTAHGDVYSISLSVGPQDLGDNPDIAEVVEVATPIPGIMECGAPINSGPQHYVMNAALDALNRWVAGGAPPPSAPRMEVTTAGSEVSAVTDEHGNILGGIRTAWVDVPVATLTGEPGGGGSFCGLFGSTTLFDQAKLLELYPDKATYLAAMTASIEQSVVDGFILRPDADLILQNAATNAIPTSGR